MPIQRNEWRKFLTVAFMMMLVVYVYSILRASKDTIVVTLMSAELISTLKLYGTLPMAVLFMLLYTKLVDFIPRIQLFHLINAFFIGFFVLFAFVLFPNAELIHPDLSSWSEAMPYCKYIIVMISHWSFSLYYVLSELWGSVMLSLLFWQLANQITSIAEAKRFYPMFGLLAQVGLISSGQLVRWFASISTASGTGWGGSLQYIALSVLFSGMALSFFMYMLSKIVDVDLINGNISLSSRTPKKKIKMGLMESLRYIMSSRYIGLIATLIICYGVSINLVEGIWKQAIHIVHPDPNSYASYMGHVQYWTGIFTVSGMLCGAFLLRLMRWRTAALLTPIMIFITGVLFFTFIVFRDSIGSTIETFGVTSMFLAALFGTIQNVLSKATKYSFFDSTKEMSYIPLDEDLKAKGKAAAEVIGGRFGKSGGAVIQWAFVQIFFLGSSLIDLAPYFLCIFVVMLCIWVMAVLALSKEFTAKSAEAGHTQA